MIDIGTLSGSLELEDNFSNAFELLVENVEKGTELLEHAFGDVGIAAGVVATAVVTTAAAIVEMGNKGSEIADLEENFNRLAGSAENADEIIKAMKTGVAGTVDSLVLLKDANRALSTGAAQTAEQFQTMTSAARVLSREGFGPVEQVLQQVERALATGRTRQLQYLTGTIDTQKAETEYAKSIGVTRKELSQAERVYADRLAIFDKLNKKVKDAGDLELSFAERIKVARVAVADWSDELFKAVATSPAVNKAFKDIGDAIVKTFGGAGQTATEMIVGFINRFAEVVGHYVPIIIEWLGKIYNSIIDIWHAVQEAWSLVPDWFKNVAKEAALTAGAIGLVNVATEHLTGQDVLSNLASIAQIYSTWGGLVKNLASGIKEFFQAVMVFGAAEALPAWFPKLTTFLTSLPELFAEATGPIATFGAAIFDLSNPIGWIIGAITAMTLGLRLLTGSWEFITTPLKLAWQFLKDVWTIMMDVREQIMVLADPALKLLGDAFTVVGGIIKDIFLDQLHQAQDEVRAFWELLLYIPGPVKDTLTQLAIIFAYVHEKAEQVRKEQPLTSKGFAGTGFLAPGVSPQGPGGGPLPGGPPPHVDTGAAGKKIADETEKSINRTQQLWDQYYQIQDKMAGDDLQVKIDAIERWYDKEIDAIDKTEQYNKNFINERIALLELYKAKVAEVEQEATEKSIESSRKAMEDAQSAVAKSLGGQNVLQTLAQSSAKFTAQMKTSWGELSTGPLLQSRQLVFDIVQKLESGAPLISHALEGIGKPMTVFKDAAQQTADIVNQKVVEAMNRAARSLMPLNDQTKQWIQELHEAGYTAQEIADILGISLQSVQKEIGMTRQGFDDMLSDWSATLTQMAQISGDKFGGIVKDIANIVVSLKAAEEAAANFRKAADEGSKAGQALALVQGAMAVAQATGSGSTGSRILGGAATGASVGSNFGPWGTAIGAGVGAVVGAIRGIGAPSKTELAGRDLEKQFQSQFKNFDDMVNSIGKAYATTGKTLEQARTDVKSLLDAEKQGPEAVQAIIDKLNASLKAAQEIDDAISGLGIKSHDDLQHAADVARQAYEKVAEGVKTGQYTAEDAEKAYRAFQQALADMGDEAAKAWLKAHEAAVSGADLASQAGYKTLDELKSEADKARQLAEYMRDSGKFAAADVEDAFKKADEAAARAMGISQELLDKRKSLQDAISQEAPEADMGVIEKQQRDELDKINKQIETAAGKAGDAVTDISDKVTKGWQEGWEKTGKIVIDTSGESSKKAAELYGAAGDEMKDHLEIVTNNMKDDFDGVATEATTTAGTIDSEFGGLEFTIPIHFSVDPFPDINPNRNNSGGNNNEGAHPMAEGGVGYAPAPMLFSTKGNEYFAFSGEGKTFGGIGGDQTAVVREIRFLSESIDKLASRPVSVQIDRKEVARQLTLALSDIGEERSLFQDVVGIRRNS